MRKAAKVHRNLEDLAKLTGRDPAELAKALVQAVQNAGKPADAPEASPQTPPPASDDR